MAVPRSPEPKAILVMSGTFSDLMGESLCVDIIYEDASVSSGVYRVK